MGGIQKKFDRVILKQRKRTRQTKLVRSISIGIVGHRLVAINAHAAL
jgi:hypothetical protein